MMHENEKAPDSLLPTLIRRLDLNSTTSSPSIESTQWSTRVAATKALGKRQDASLEFLLNAMDDEDESVRAAAVRAVERLGEQVPIERVVEALHDPSWLVREAAILTLGTLGKSISLESLYDESMFVREATTLVLKQRHVPLYRTFGYMHHVWSSVRKAGGRTMLGEQLDSDNHENTIGKVISSPQRAKRRPMMHIVEGAVAALVVMGLLLSWLVLTHVLQGSTVGGSDSYLGPPLWTYHNENAITNEIHWTSDSKYLSFDNELSTVHVVNIATKQLKGYPMPAYTSFDTRAIGQREGSTSFSPNGQYLGVVDNNSGQQPIVHVQVWTAVTGQQLFDYSYSVPSEPTTQSPSIQWSPDSTYLSVNDNNGVILLWNAGTQQNPFILHGNSFPLDNIVWSRDGQHLAVNTKNGQIEVWNVITRQRTLRTSVPSTIRALALSPDGKRIAVATNQKTIQVLDATTGDRLQTYPDSMENVYLGPEWTPDGSHIVSINNVTASTQNIRIWNATTGHTLLDAPVAYQLGWSLSPNGRYVAAETPDKSAVQVWDTTTGRNVATHYDASLPSGQLPGWSPDSRYLVTVRSDNAVQVWNATIGRNGYTYRSNSQSIMWAVWSPNGKYLATQSTIKTQNGFSDSFSLKGSTIEIWRAPK